MSSNRVVIHKDGYIEQKYVGSQDAQDIVAVGNTTQELIEQLRSAKQKVHILVDISELGHLTTAARKTAADTIKALDYRKMAVYCDDMLRRALSGLIIYASGKSSSIKIFDKRAAAEAWLLNNQD